MKYLVSYIQMQIIMTSPPALAVELSGRNLCTGMKSPSTLRHQVAASFLSALTNSKSEDYGPIAGDPVSSSARQADRVVRSDS